MSKGKNPFLVTHFREKNSGGHGLDQPENSGTMAPSAGPLLTNSTGLGLTSLRISVTNRCNEHCLYCRPERIVDVVSPGLHRDELTKEEIFSIAHALVQVGVTAIRLTGGEPLVRTDLEEIIAGLSSIDPRPHLRLTTNGIGLARRARALAEAGLDRVNVSLDSVDHDTYAKMTGRNALDDVVAGIAAAHHVGLTPLRTNTVVCAGLNDGELEEICTTVWSLGAVPRFIELMPMGPLGLERDRLVSAEEIHSRIDRAFGPLVAVGPDNQAGPSLYYETKTAQRLGIIASVTGHICDTCNRGRITSRGGLQSCLAGPVVADLRKAWREGGTKAVQQAAGEAAAAKVPRHGWPGAAAMIDVGG